MANVPEPPKKILAVDDNPENRALVEAILEDEGYSVMLAASGEEALQAFSTDPPDLVLLDVRMPKMDGFEVCKRLRATPAGAETPVIFLTALRDLETFDQALRAGGDDFLTKPLNATKLLVRVGTALKLRQMGAELREHYDLVRSQRDELMRLGLQKERLTAFLVHDLKSPVSSMDLHAQVLLRDPEIGARARESVEHIREEARSLLRLVLNLLDISKSDEGTLVARRGPVDLEALSAEVVEAFEVRARVSEVELERAIEAVPLWADADLLRRLIENLLDNAIRHAPPGSEVRLTAGPCQEGIEIRVADRGSGILPEMRQKIFDRFVQVESTDRGLTRTGRGLGLAFCKLVAEAHGGSIGVEDGRPGTVFWVRLPRG